MEEGIENPGKSSCASGSSEKMEEWMPADRPGDRSAAACPQDEPCRQAAGETVPVSMLRQIEAVFPPAQTDVRQYSPLALAFLGDGVYSLIIRTFIIEKGNRQAQKLHNETKSLVSAQAQAAVSDAILGLLTTEELRIWHRGHNANPEHRARHATLEEYLKATALESLCGYLYLSDEMPRLLMLLREGLRTTGQLAG